MRILFDNNAFAYLSQESQRTDLFNHLKELVDCSKIEIVGSCSMLEELTGLAKVDFALYQKTLSQYEELTKVKILRAWNELIFQEVTQLEPVLLENSFFDKRTAQRLFNLMKSMKHTVSISNNVYMQCQSYKQGMEEAGLIVLSNPLLINKHRKVIIKDYKDWFKNFDNNAQDWFIEIFKVRANISYKQLPHVRAFFNYVLTRIYERFSLRLPDRSTDFYDRAHFVDAVVVDILVTNDEAFIRTCSRVPYRSFDVVRINELASRIEKC